MTWGLIADVKLYTQQCILQVEYNNVLEHSLVASYWMDSCCTCAVLLCLVCLTLLASFFLPSHLSLTCINIYRYVLQKICTWTLLASFFHLSFKNMIIICVCVWLSWNLYGRSSWKGGHLGEDKDHHWQRASHSSTPPILPTLTKHHLHISHITH